LIVHRRQAPIYFCSPIGRLARAARVYAQLGNLSDQCCLFVTEFPEQPVLLNRLLPKLAPPL
jgi:hypothetical protein